LQTSPSTNTLSPPQAKPILTPGAKAGIGIGGSVVSILLISLLWFFFFQQGKKLAARKSKTPETASRFEKAELGEELPLSKE
jgi:hypothetical protein